MPVPTLVAGVRGIRAIAAGLVHMVALTEAGTVMTWGDNNYYDLGRCKNGPPQGPGFVPGLSGVQSIAATAATTTAGPRVRPGHDVGRRAAVDAARVRRSRVRANANPAVARRIRTTLILEGVRTK